jgi:mRNA interferase RelE/StbE
VTPYSVRFKASVEKDLRRIPSAARTRCLDRIKQLVDDPRPQNVVRLTGAEHTFRLRVSTYRIVYQVDDAEHSVTIIHVRHRKDAYR